jgi:MarR family transcriptional regulator, organic hydroperoxide resistance regulator
MTRLQETPMRSAYLALIQVHEHLTTESNALFRDHGLTSAQFNVLRILILGPHEGVPCSRIAEELIHRVPDVTRLVDRMLKAGLVTRERSTEDRRVVLVRLTPEGREACEALYGPLNTLHKRQFAHLDRSSVKALDRLLRDVLTQ